MLFHLMYVLACFTSSHDIVFAGKDFRDGPLCHLTDWEVVRLPELLRFCGVLSSGCGRDTVPMANK